MRFSRQSNRSNFSGLSSAYSNLNKSRIEKEDTPSNTLVTILIIIFSTLICLQLYYIAKDGEWENTFRLASTGVILAFVLIIWFGATKWVWAEQNRNDIRTIPIIETEDFEDQKVIVTRSEIDKLKRDPSFIKLQKRSRKGSSSYEKLT